VWRVLAFNVGVELAQLFGAAAALLPGAGAWHWVRQRISWAATCRAAHVTLVIAGLATGMVLVFTVGPAVAATGHGQAAKSAVTHDPVVRVVGFPGAH
jgi:hypothetical protein